MSAPVVPLGAPEPVPTYIRSGVGKPPGLPPLPEPRYTTLDPSQPTGTTATNPLSTEASLPPPGTRFQTWRAGPIPTDPQELIAFRREAVDIFIGTDAIGAELGGDLALTQSVLAET